jgi:phosphotransacetylase
LAAAVQQMPRKSTVAVVAANDKHTIESVVAAHEDGLIEAALIGDRDFILAELEARGAAPTNFAIIDAASTDACLAEAVDLIHTGGANVLMKGSLQTGDFMRAILNKENNLRASGTLSVAGFFEMPGYHKLLALSDMAINVYPDLETKKTITTNAVGLLHACGIEQPKVAILAAVEQPNPKMKEAVDGEALAAMNAAGEITGCTIAGPISFDIATSAGAAAIKGYNGPVAGDADLLVAPDLVCGNVLAKALTGFAGAITAGTVLGAAVPVVLVPRSAEASDKYYSIALAAYTAPSFAGGKDV